MKNITFGFFIMLLIVLVSISGCQDIMIIPPTPTTTPVSPTPIIEVALAQTKTPQLESIVATRNPSYHTNNGIPLGANLNCTNREAFGRLEENVPASNALVSDDYIHFRWYYFAAEGAAPDWSTVCVPTTFTLYLSPAPSYNTTITYSITPTIVDDLGNILRYSVDISNTLQPHTSYRWIVVGHVDGIDIDEDQLPLFQDESAWKRVDGLSLMHGQFQTGPECYLQTINPVTLLNPQDETALDTDTPYFQWDMPNCSSRAYWLTIDTDPLMASPDNGWVTGQEGFLMFSGSLQPCIVYYWQVHAGLYSMNYHLSRGDWASASDIRSFIIRSADCPDAATIPTATPTAIIIPTAIPTQTPAPTKAPQTTPKPTKIPLVTPIVCSNYTDQESCEAHDVCAWYQPSPSSGGGTPCCINRP